MKQRVVLWLALVVLFFGNAFFLLSADSVEIARRFIGIDVPSAAEARARLQLLERENAQLRQSREELRLATIALVAATSGLVLAHSALELKKATAEARVARQRAAAGKLVKQAHGRITRAVQKGLATLVPRSVPGMGIAVNVSVLAMEVVEACLLLKELNEMAAEHGEAPVDAQSTCGMRVLTVDEIRAKLPRTDGQGL